MVNFVSCNQQVSVIQLADEVLAGKSLSFEVMVRYYLRMLPENDYAGRIVDDGLLNHGSRARITTALL